MKIPVSIKRVPDTDQRIGVHSDGTRIDEAELPDRMTYLRLDAKANKRRDVTESPIILSGGRVITSSDDVERWVGRLADDGLIADVDDAVPALIEKLNDI